LFQQLQHQTYNTLFPYTTLFRSIKKNHPHVTSIMHNINPERTNVILGKETNCLWGASYIHDKIGDLTFAISAKSFYQVNPEQTRSEEHTSELQSRFDIVCRLLLE